MKTPEVVYVLTGFQQDAGFRVFSFERTDPKPGSAATVRVDLALARKHGILTQELPLLCREALEQVADRSKALHLTYSEDAMAACASVRLAQRALATRKKLWNHTREAPSDAGAGTSTGTGNAPDVVR